ncbi:hypothetical protein VP01_62g14 [Puccinia sorghi]|uniref:Uncharacterized protein n=1 Tax=Puccinia sorghi TaxID=27349 RepID=A0A0L6UG95_9BASI|nr:hypothetical protein VP01_62g14 [Puccinia sorghi]
MSRKCGLGSGKWIYDDDTMITWLIADGLEYNSPRTQGQVYVALSRATSLHRLQVLGFAPPKVRTHQVVVNWAKKVLAES